MRFLGADRFIAASVADFVICGLKGGEACITIASRDHLTNIEAGVESAGIELEYLRSKGAYNSFETGHVLKLISEQRIPVKQLLEDFLRSTLSASEGFPPSRIYEELVADVLQAGNVEHAAALETYWFEIGRDMSLTLYSLYYAEGAANQQINDPETVRRSGPHVLDESRLHDESYLRSQAQRLKAELEELDRSIARRTKPPSNQDS